MTELKFNLDDTQLQSALSTAIMAQLNDKAREDIIAAAIKYLTTPVETHRFGPKKSPIDDAFERALGQEVNRLTHEWVKDRSDIQAAIGERLEECAKELLKENSAMARQVARALADFVVEKE